MRLIDADKLKTELDAWARSICESDVYCREDALYIIDSMPTIDAEPVVWCKDCIKRNTSDCAMWYKCEQCGGQWSWETNNDYCSYGTKI